MVSHLSASITRFFSDDLRPLASSSMRHERFCTTAERRHPASFLLISRAHPPSMRCHKEGFPRLRDV